jgi:hypothetical protein
VDELEHGLDRLPLVPKVFRHSTTPRARAEASDLRRE